MRLRFALKKNALKAVVVALSAICVTVVAPPQAAHAGFNFNGHYIANYNSGKCLVARGFANYTPVVQTTCAQYSDQYWEIFFTGEGTYQFRHVMSGKCLVVRGTAENAKAELYTCNMFWRDQLWYLEGDGDVRQLDNVNSEKCLVVRGTAEGTQAVQSSCNWIYQDQLWFMR